MESAVFKSISFLEALLSDENVPQRAPDYFIAEIREFIVKLEFFRNYVRRGLKGQKELIDFLPTYLE